MSEFERLLEARAAAGSRPWSLLVRISAGVVIAALLLLSFEQPLRGLWRLVH